MLRIVLNLNPNDQSVSSPQKFWVYNYELVSIQNHITTI